MSIVGRIAHRAGLLWGRVRYERFNRPLDERGIAARLRPDLRHQLGTGGGLARRLLAFIEDGDGEPVRTFDDRARQRYQAQHADLIDRTVMLSGTMRKLGSPTDWHRDPQFGVSWPRRYAHSIPDFNEGSDLTMLWHLNKMHFLLDYSGAYVATGDEHLRREWLSLVESWCRDNPYLIGKNWRAAMEMGTRVVTWAVSMREMKLSDVITEEATTLIVGSMVQQAEYLAAHPAKKPLPNNHLIADAATLYMYAALWPVWCEAAAWARSSESVLESEIKRQVLPDGMSYENSFNYHAFVLDFYLLFLLTKTLEHEAPSASMLDGIRSLAAVYVAALSPAGREPNFGDGSMSEFFVLKNLSDRKSVPLEDPVTLASLLRPEIAGTLSRTSWGREILGICAPLEGCIHFAAAGYSVFRGRHSHLVYAAGPEHTLDFNSGHLHSDAGSLEVEINGHPVLIDAGTYLYYRSSEDREHFRSARAHNTLLIDGVDPMEPDDTFAWKSVARGKTSFWHADARLNVVASDRNIGSANGRAFVHRRMLISWAESVWLVIDQVKAEPSAAGDEPTTESLAEVFFHTACGADGVRRAAPNTVTLTIMADNGRAESLTFGGWARSGYLMEVTGGAGDRMTWWSETYGQRRVGATIVARAPLTRELLIVHALSKSRFEVHEPTFTEHGADVTVLEADGGEHRFSIDPGHPGLSVDGQHVNGDVVRSSAASIPTRGPVR